MDTTSLEMLPGKSTSRVQYTSLNSTKVSGDGGQNANPSGHLSAWWMSLLHVLLTSILAVLALTVINGHRFLVDAQNGRKSTEGTFMLYQSDMTTIISAALVLVRLSAAAWFTLVKCRSTFMHLERASMTLSQVSWALQYGLPYWNRYRGGSRALEPSKVHSAKVLIFFVWLAVFIVLPAQLLSPLASGAFTWVPAQMPAVKSLVEIAQGANGWGWEYLVEFQEHQFLTILRSAGIAASHSNARFTSDYHPILRRFLPELRKKSTGDNIVGSVILPHLAISSFEWISDLDQITGSENRSINSVFDDSNTNLMFSSDENPFTHPSNTYTTATTLVLDESWQKPPLTTRAPPYTYDYPKPHTLQQSLLVAVFVTRNDSNAMMKDCYSSSGPYGAIPQSIALYGTYINPNDAPALDNCYAFARITFNAGVVNCTSCPLIADGTLEMDMSAERHRNVPIQPDPMVSTAVHMIPEVLTYITRMNSTAIPTWQNLDGYAKGILSLAYQCSWNALALRMTDTTSTYTTSIAGAVSVVVAKVAAGRIYAWLGLNLLILVSAGILTYFQRWCRGGPIMDPGMYLTMLDSSDVVQGESIQNCSTGELTKRGRRKMVKLSIQSDDDNAEVSQRGTRRDRLIALE